MATSNVTAVNSLCKKCKTVPNSEVTDEFLIMYCDKNENKTGDSVDTAFFDAVESITADENKNVFFNYIIRQKDTLISELKDKIQVLNQHTILLNKFNFSNQATLQDEVDKSNDLNKKCLNAVIKKK
ncbi:unnamed protein product [Psylliodes chrysocephalus]|uniref:Uncharacterized protein n=1 Tax=Psylliodes chrysocephalus TaxID=3402493 RepID=A0A9P0CZJ1_9CUCU|nr:unnamed protein product [Psylliodes chrysocephala]